MKQNGFTIIELVIVVAVLAVLSGITVTDFLSFKRQTDLSDNTQEVAGVLLLAQNKTLSSEGDSQYGVYFDAVNGKYTLYKGASYIGRDASYDQVNYLSNEVEFFGISLGGGNEVVFNKLTGVPNQSGSISLRLKSDNSQTKSVYVSGSGVVSFVAPLSPSDNSRVKDSRHVHINYSRVINTATETITLNFNNGAVVQTFPINAYLVSGQIEWQGTVSVAGSNQTVEIHTHRLNNTDTQFSIHRDDRLNNALLTITISGDTSGNLINYSADGLTTTSSSIYASNLAWQ